MERTPWKSLPGFEYIGISPLSAEQLPERFLSSNGGQVVVVLLRATSHVCFRASDLEQECNPVEKAELM